MEVVNSGTTDQTIPFKFTGAGWEYYKIWIVNICLSIVTLGIYSAWAKVRTNRYFYGNTLLDNSNFSYLAEPMQILKGRIISVIIFGLYWAGLTFYPKAGIGFMILLTVLTPFFIVSSMSFRMYNTGYRNIRFRFNKDIAGAYATFLLPIVAIVVITWAVYTLASASGFLDGMVDSANSGVEEGAQPLTTIDFFFMIFSFVLMPFLPWLDFLRTRFIIKNTQYGKAEAKFSAGAWDFYKVYLLSVLYYLIVGAVFGAIGYFVLNSWGDISIAALLPLMVIPIYTLAIFISGIWKAMRTNMINGNIKIGENQLASDLSGLTVGWIYISNTIAIICSLGMLIPWSKIRMARYTMSHTEMNVKDIDSIRAAEKSDSSAFGEEIGEVFDMELGF